MFFYVTCFLSFCSYYLLLLRRRGPLRDEDGVDEVDDAVGARDVGTLHVRTVNLDVVGASGPGRSLLLDVKVMAVERRQLLPVSQTFSVLRAVHHVVFEHLARAVLLANSL